MGNQGVPNKSIRRVLQASMDALVDGARRLRRLRDVQPRGRDLIARELAGEAGVQAGWSTRDESAGDGRLKIEFELEFDATTGEVEP